MVELVNQARNGDEEAFICLMEQNKTGLYKVARSYLRSEEDIADVLQETILDCYEKLPSLREAGYFKTWATRILINHCIDLLRKNAREYPVDREQLEQVREQAASWQGGGSQPSAALVEFWQMLDRIDEKYRVILVLYYVQGFNAREIAQLLNMPEATVSSRLRRGRENYRRELEVC